MTVCEVRPEQCACGNTTFALTTPYHTHQVIELPPIAMNVTHWILHQGWCVSCGRWTKTQMPAEHAMGFGPRFSALMGFATFHRITWWSVLFLIESHPR
jgi:hypothetical protein